MTRTLLCFVLALACTAPALACDGKDGECCRGKKAVLDVTPADSELARQAAASMLETSDAPTGELAPEQRAALEHDAHAVATSVRTQKAPSCCDGEGSACCDEPADCCAHAAEGPASALDGAHAVVNGDKCPKHGR
jgi:hypothetical protein